VVVEQISGEVCSTNAQDSSWSLGRFRFRGNTDLSPTAKCPGFLSTTGLNIGLVLRESAEFVPYNQDPGRGKEGIHDYGETEAGERSDPEDAGGHAQVGGELIEHAP
jgi:hypothetical protein